MRSGWNGSKSSSFSPVPANRIGLPTTSFTDSAAPPRASPSILVSTTPVRPTASSNSVATFTASWPVIASTTSSVSFGCTASRTRAARPSARRRPGAGRRCRRSRRRARAAPLRRGPPRATATGSVGSEYTGTPTRSPSTRSCSTAAGRWRSAPTSSGRRPWLSRSCASFADAVVFPEPWRPAIITTLGGFDDTVSLPVVPPRVSTSSSLTILMTCCAGLRLFATSAPRARSFTRAMNVASDADVDVGLEQRDPQLAARPRRSPCR